MEDRLRVVRKPGFAAVDAFVFLILFFTAGRGLGGLRGFAEDHGEWAEVLGAVAGRQRLMSASALSRLLDATRAGELVSTFRWILRDLSGALDVLRSPAVQTRDARRAGRGVARLRLRSQPRGVSQAGPSAWCRPAPWGEADARPGGARIG